MLNNSESRRSTCLDQDQALDFYVGKLGLEVHSDADLGFMRWLTVTSRAPEREILLEKPGPPALSEATAAEVRALLTKGASGGTLFFRCDDACKTHDELKEKGVETARGARATAATGSTSGCATRSATTSASAEMRQS